MKYLKTYENWYSVHEPSHHTEDWFQDCFEESDNELKPGDFVKTVSAESGTFDKRHKRYHRIVYGIWDGKSVECFTKDKHTVRKPEWVKKVELKVPLGQFLKKFWEYAQTEL